MNRTLVSIFALTLALTACATAELSRKGASVVAAQTAPYGDCVVLGTVIGEGGGSFGGGMISNASLVEYAMNDARNKAGELGANYVQLGQPALGVSGGDGGTTTTTATVLGTAYRCSGEVRAISAE